MPTRLSCSLNHSAPRALGALWFKLQDNLVGMRRVFQIIDQQADQERHGNETLETVREGLKIDQVSYTYPDGTPVLDSVSLDARVGEMIAIISPTRASKETLSSTGVPSG